MKKFLAILMAAMMLVAMSACGGSSEDATTAKDIVLTMGTGGEAGTYYAYGGVLSQQIMDTTGYDTAHVTTGGSKANIEGIDFGDYNLGTVQSDVMAYAWNGERSFEGAKVDSFRTIAGLYPETVQLVTMDPAIKSVADLKGKDVSIGAQGSGVYFNAIDALTAAGLTEEDINAHYLSFDASADNLKDGVIDAAFIVAGAPTPAIEQLRATNDAWLVPIDGEIAAKMMEANPFYSTITIDSYKGLDPVETVTVKATLIVDADMSEEAVYNITAAIFDNAEAIAAVHAKGLELSVENATSGLDVVPFHKGAAKYYAEKGITVTAE